MSGLNKVKFLISLVFCFFDLFVCSVYLSRCLVVRRTLVVNRICAYFFVSFCSATVTRVLLFSDRYEWSFVLCLTVVLTFGFLLLSFSLVTVLLSLYLFKYLLLLCPVVSCICVFLFSVLFGFPSVFSLPRWYSLVFSPDNSFQFSVVSHDFL